MPPVTQGRGDLIFPVPFEQVYYAQKCILIEILLGSMTSVSLANGSNTIFI